MNTFTLPEPTATSQLAAPGDPAQILVVDDDAGVRRHLAEGLGRDGHRMLMAADLNSARNQIERTELDALLLDLELPGGTGYDLLRELRGGRLGPRMDLPVLMVSGHADEIERIRGFELGCDDFIAKPFSFFELRGRLAAVLRRSDPQRNDHRSVVATIAIDRRARAVFVEDQRVELTAKEYALLLALAEDPLRVYTREELLVAVWGYRAQHSSRTLDAHACRLRSKLSRGELGYVANVWGVGYRLLEHAKTDVEVEL